MAATPYFCVVRRLSTGRLSTPERDHPYFSVRFLCIIKEPPQKSLPMKKDTKRTVLATAQLVGAIIGVGVFGVPYALSKIGPVLGLAYFALLGAIQLLQHLFFAEAAIACPEKLRLPGLAERYIGPGAKHIAAVATIFGYWAGLLAYMVVGGTFLHILLSPFLGGQPFVYQVAWSLGGALLVYFGLDIVSRVDFFATVGLLVAMIALIAIGVPHVQPVHFFNTAITDLVLPYGVILFSLSGLPAILEMEDILKGRHTHYRFAITVGTLLAIVLTAAFGYVVWGVTGAGVTQDAVIGLRGVLGDRISVLAAAFGFLAVSTSFFATAINLQSTIQYDYKKSRFTAWLLTGGVPFVIFLWGAKNFVSIISFSGAVFGGVTAVLVAMLYIAVTKKKLLKGNALGVPLGFAYLSIAILSTGAAYEIWTSAARLMK